MVDSGGPGRSRRAASPAADALQLEPRQARAQTRIYADEGVGACPAQISVQRQLQGDGLGVSIIPRSPARSLPLRHCTGRLGTACWVIHHSRAFWHRARSAEFPEGRWAASARQRRSGDLAASAGRMSRRHSPPGHLRGGSCVSTPCPQPSSTLRLFADARTAQERPRPFKPIDRSCDCSRWQVGGTARHQRPRRRMRRHRRSRRRHSLHPRRPHLGHRGQRVHRHVSTDRSMIRSCGRLDGYAIQRRGQRRDVLGPARERRRHHRA